MLQRTLKRPELSTFAQILHNSRSGWMCLQRARESKHALRTIVSSATKFTCDLYSAISTTMAIPFALPSDEETQENYQRLEQLWLELSDVIRRILLARHARESSTPLTSSSLVHSPRVRSSSSSQRRDVDGEGPPLPDIGNLPDLVANLSLLPSTAPSVFRGGIDAPPMLDMRRGRRHRTASESSCCEEAKSAINNAVAQELSDPDWNQEDPQSKRPCSSDGLFSMLPAPSIWTTTAVIFGICWHLLRAR